VALDGSDRNDFGFRIDVDFGFGWRFSRLSSSRTLQAAPPRPSAAARHRRRGQVPVRPRHGSGEDKKCSTARENFRNIVDNYPQSTYRPDAKLAPGRLLTITPGGGTENLLLAANEFREFLTFYPTHQRADYAQLQLARSYTEQMLAPERDQTSTRDAIKEIEIFCSGFPNSQLMPEARKMERQAKDRLSEANYRVGFYYYRIKWYTGAIDRFKDVLKSDPQYSNRDALYSTWPNRSICRARTTSWVRSRKRPARRPCPITSGS
jgi:hypothetical protein